MKKEMPRCPPTFDNLYEYFLTRAKKNLHVVLCFSPVSFFSYLSSLLPLANYPIRCDRIFQALYFQGDVKMHKKITEV